MNSSSSDIQPIENLTAEQARGIRYILTDIDDTLTREGRLLREAFSALWDLKEAGLRVVPVTGRPAGWCDCIARQWPVDAVVGENGAFVYYMEKGRLGDFEHPSVADSGVRDRLGILGKDVLRRVPGSRIAKDQFSRRFDLAIDFNEEPPHLGLDAAERIKDICVEHGATAKISSIHVNAWFGEYDKLSMARLFLLEKWGIDVSADRNSVFFCGDSPNDEPMFSYFPLSCGVGNVREFLRLMKSKPGYITVSSFGSGFAEAARIILRRRSGIFR